MQFIFSYLIVSGWTISSSNIGNCVGQWKGELSSLESGFGHWTHSVTRGHRSGQWDHFGPANSAGGKKNYKIIVFKNQRKCLIFKHFKIILSFRGKKQYVNCIRYYISSAKIHMRHFWWISVKSQYLKVSQKVSFCNICKQKKKKMNFLIQVERERWRAASSQRMGQFLMPSASTGNIPGGFRSLQGKIIRKPVEMHFDNWLAF